ncbi:MAG: hypothetical protein A4E32_00367 [Methanomassiliicoccales archaeon PtaU1.Bin124]|nr:MAG: hypothetical protein A4E32_00367 [Methanomassiliicoccales archaeon PtaU1.Bin124]
MRVLHVENPAGVPYALSRGQREAGAESDVLETWKLPYAYGHDLENYYTGGVKDILRLARTVNIGRRYDIIHLHTGLPRKRLDMVALRLFFGKPLVVHYHGSETRKGYGMYYRSLVDLRLVSTPDLLGYHPDAFYVPNPMKEMPQAPWPTGRLRILHLPTNREIKGTVRLEAALEGLKARYDFELVVREGMTHEAALKEMACAHLIVDEVGDTTSTGVRGRLNVAALEAMMLGRPVITNLDQDMMAYYPGCPVQNISQGVASLQERLEQALSHPERLAEIGRKGREYVLSNHDPKKVAEMVYKLYAAHLRL